MIRSASVDVFNNEPKTNQSMSVLQTITKNVSTKFDSYEESLKYTGSQRNSVPQQSY